MREQHISHSTYSAMNDRTSEAIKVATNLQQVALLIAVLSECDV